MKRQKTKWDRLTLKEKFKFVQNNQKVIDEIAVLEETKRLPKGDVWLTAIDKDGDEYFDPIDILPAEYAAIRRYLIRNRRRLLKKEGLL